MPTYLLHDTALRSPELRHEIVEPIGDEITFVEHEGTRLVIGSVLEEAIFRKREDVVDEFWTWTELGFEDLIRDDSLPVAQVFAELTLRALRKLGASSVTVPPAFQVLVADYLRDRGVDIVVDEETWFERRRRKTPAELEGMERAQRAAETAMLTAARMLRDAEPTATGQLRFEGEILTAELIRDAMKSDLGSQGADCEEILIHSGDACLLGHEAGMGPILPDRSCIVDCFPRDRRSGAYSDMTRTFVPGEPSRELRKLHADCGRAMEIALDSVRPGRDDAFSKVAAFFESEGYPTVASHRGEVPLRQGFFHSLGHGVGLEVHERPFMGRRPDALVEGDVVAVEPGLYFEGVGGVRLEDTVIVTDAGPERFTDPYPYELEP